MVVHLFQIMARKSKSKNYRIRHSQFQNPSQKQPKIKLLISQRELVQHVKRESKKKTKLKITHNNYLIKINPPQSQELVLQLSGSQLQMNFQLHQTIRRCLLNQYNRSNHSLNKNQRQVRGRTLKSKIKLLMIIQQISITTKTL